MSLVGEAALTALFETLFKKIPSVVLKFVADKEDVDEIKNWKTKLENIRDVLDDAESKQMTETSVKNWMNDLKDLAYDVEDVLDEIATESLRPTLEGEPKTNTSKVRNFITGWSASHTPFSFNSEMDSKIKKITARLQIISDQRNNLTLLKIAGGASGYSRRQPLTASVIDEPRVYGRDEDKRKILDLLTRDDSTEANIGVLPIVGMAGVGKTTLARLIYDDESVKQQFPTRAWVCVSVEFDITRITRCILESITLQACNFNDILVQEKLHTELQSKKFLIVLDDVWSESYDDWNLLRSIFMAGAHGSRVIVTTRNDAVALNMETIKFHRLRHISDDDCWKLFKRHALEGCPRPTTANLESFRERVTRKCSGLPLAARTLGGLLRSKPGDKWEEILDSSLWNLKETENRGIRPVFWLSYYHLPSYLKRCFSYCAIFPKDYEFTEMELVPLWMAEGLIQKAGEKHTMDVGVEYFRDLLSRCLFQAGSSDALSRNRKFVMHDLVHDLAQNVAEETCLSLEDALYGKKKFDGERVRYSSYICSKYDGVEKFQPFNDMPKLRTFLPLSHEAFVGKYRLFNYLSGDVLLRLIPRLTCLRILSLKGYEIYEIPGSIGDLKHLRYLDLSFTDIRSLPEKITLLYNLQTLILRDCRRLKELPSRIEDLINLSYLDINQTDLEEWLMLNVDKLVNLKELAFLFVGKLSVSGENIKALKNMKFLKGELRISHLGKVSDVLHGREANLQEKVGVHVLSLDWEKSYAGDVSPYHRQLLHELKPHFKLEQLNIKRYQGTTFPDWVGCAIFQKLKILRLYDCKECTSLPSLGLLPSLKELHVQSMNSVTSVGSEFYVVGCSSPFPALQKLCFDSMDEFQDWNPCDFKFPCLEELTIKLCPKLSGKLPIHLSTLKKLDIWECEELVVSLPSLPGILEIRIVGCKEVDFTNMVEFGLPDRVELMPSRFTLSATNGLIVDQLMKSKTFVEGGEPLFLPALINFNFNVAEGGEKKRSAVQRLEELVFYQSPKLEELVFLQDVCFPSTIRKINLKKCDALMSLPKTAGLEELVIEKCNSLILIRGDQLSSSLKSLHIEECGNLKSLELDSSLVSLNLLMVNRCNSLISLHISSSLKLESLHVASCDALTSLSLPLTLELKSLTVESCDSLTSLSATELELPASLELLRIYSCHKLESLAESFENNMCLQSIDIKWCGLKCLPDNLHNLTRLSKIYLFDCNDLVFVQGSLPTTSCLKELEVLYCDNVKALPENLTSLEKVRISRSTEGIVFFPETGFPTNLKTLGIKNVMLCESLPELHKFTSLTYLSIQGGCPDMVSFPEMVSSLIQLSISDFPKLQHLSDDGFKNLTSLEVLELRNCPNLAFFPKNGLPLSLLRLDICGCPKLKQRCEKDKGEDWNMIARIPRIGIYCVDADFRDTFAEWAQQLLLHLRVRSCPLD